MDTATVAAFRKMLGEELPEQDYQRFLEQHTEFIPREFVQNHQIHFRLVLRKLSLAADLVTDFFYLSKSSDDWNCVLIEIEKPYSRFFKEKTKTNEFHPDFSAALQQINRWRAWLGDPANAHFFTENVVGFLREPLHKNPCFFKYVLVHGRRAEYEGNDIRRGLVRAQEQADFKILTYDSLLDYPHDDQLYVGAKNNNGLSLLSDEVLGDVMFNYVDATQIDVSADFHKQASDPAKWFTRRAPSLEFVMKDVLPKLRVRS